MDGVSATVYTKLRRYWRRRGYRRIDEPAKRRGNPIQLGSAGARRRRFWRIKSKPKLKLLKKASPKRFLVWLRDSYVNMMVGFANTRVVGPGYGDNPGFGRGPLKEYDERMIIQIYKSLMIGHGQIVTADAARLPAAARVSAIVE